MRTQAFTLLLVFASAICLCGETLTSFPSDEDVSRIAAKELPAWLSRIPAGEEELYGFQDRDEFKRTAVAKPFRMCAVSSQYGVSILNEWRVPVLVDGRYRALLTVAQMGGTLKAVDFGAAALAQQLARIVDTYRLGSTTGNKFFLLRFYEATKDYVVSSPFGAPTDGDLAIPVHENRSAPVSVGDIQRSARNQ